MGWFNKKQKEDKKKDIPLLPELPKLPELPELKEKTSIQKTPIHQLPSFPTNSLGEKFSQNNIKEAITQKPLKRQLTREIPKEFKEAVKKVKSAEPVFIRIDKFEESLKIFNEIKEKILEIEKMLNEINKIKGDEEKELEMWESEIRTMKIQIENVDKDIFSKIE